MKFGKNGGQTMAAGADDKDGIAEVLRRREKRGREKRERKRERSRGGLSRAAVWCDSVAPSALV
jgi:hypothetical protein